MLPQPLIAVKNVKASRAWYEKLLGCKTGIPGSEDHPHRDVYERLVIDGRLILQLHAWDIEEHPNLMKQKGATPGHGVLLWFETDDFDTAVARARAQRVEIVEEPHYNILHWEFWFRDPDGYMIVLASPDEEIEADDE
jgi:catechol 2,3-dioxygenase-like lactoylglutathione lyase family enzyme